MVFRLILLGMTPTLAAGQQLNTAVTAQEPAQGEVVQLVLPEGEELPLTSLDDTEGQGLIEAAAGALWGMIWGALEYTIDAAVDGGRHVSAGDS